MLTQCMAHNKTLQTGHAQMPNYFGHVTEQAVRASFNRFNNIFLIAPKECSSMLARFLCPMYAPSCADSKTLLPPCREFCVQTRSQCKRFINQAHRQNSFQWPTDLKCKNFPRKDEASCYMGPSTEVAISRPPPVPGKIYLRRVFLTSLSTRLHRYFHTLMSEAKAHCQWNSCHKNFKIVRSMFKHELA